jgi:predicted house-cleaning noncanonical NTP pyrophosphatase (MazG superfamily)
MLKGEFMKREYNKVVRDNIPNIIRNNGETPTIRILTEEDFGVELNKKLMEEIAEYNESYDVMELVDVVEVIYGILKTKNISIRKFEKLRKVKYKAKGGFEKATYLESVHTKDVLDAENPVETISELEKVEGEQFVEEDVNDGEQ